MPTTQFHYDQHWLQRKEDLPCTWQDVMKAGIMAIERANGIEPAPEPEPRRKRGRPRKGRGPYKKKVVAKKTVKNAVEEKPQTKPKTKPPEDTEEEVVEEKPKQYWFRISKPTGVFDRQFDFLKTIPGEDGKPVREWVTCPFDEIDVGSVFRVRDDGKVLQVSDMKTFIKAGTIEEEGKFQRVKIEIINPQEKAENVIV